MTEHAVIGIYIDLYNSYLLTYHHFLLKLAVVEVEFIGRNGL